MTGRQFKDFLKKLAAVGSGISAYDAYDMMYESGSLGCSHGHFDMAGHNYEPLLQVCRVASY